MRTLRHALVRALLALLALVTAVAPAAAAVGEGVLAAHAGRARVSVHVEDRRHAQCPYVHADGCVLCAAVGVHALPLARRQPVIVPLTSVGRARLEHGCARIAPRTRGVRQARGPPAN